MNASRLLLGSLISAVLSLGWFSGQAIPIRGEISISGDYEFIGGDASTALGFRSLSGFTVTDMSGAFADSGLEIGTPLRVSPFSFNQFSVLGGVPLWRTVSGPGASFTLYSIQILFQGEGALGLYGEGILHLQNYDQTPGSWEFRSEGGNSTFYFQTAGAPVPETGATAWLLLLALGGLSGTRLSLTKRT